MTPAPRKEGPAWVEPFTDKTWCIGIAGVIIRAGFAQKETLDERADAINKNLAPLLARAEMATELENSKNNAYKERDALVCAISKMFPSHLCRHPDDDVFWENDWRWIVCVHGPTGQMTWHIHDSELTMFRHLKPSDSHWDGHSTEEKYSRLAAWDSIKKEGNDK